MFCGVNAEAEKYGYPASNVSGILERLHISESIALVKQLVPSVKTIGYMIKDSPTGKLVISQVKREADTYPAKSVVFKFPKTLKEVKFMLKDLRKQCDVLFLTALQGITDENGKPLSEKEIISTVTKNFNKPTIGSNTYHVKYGALCAVVQRSQEQGATAAKMLLQTLQETPVSEIPVTQNSQGKRMINVSVMKALGIKPDTNALIGVELVTTEE